MTLLFAKPIEISVKAIYGDTGLPAARLFVSGDSEAGGAWKTSDSEGLVKLQLPPGRNHLSLLPEFGTNYLPLEHENALEVDVRRGMPDAPILMRLPPAAIVQFTVIDEATGKGVPEIELWETASGQTGQGLGHFDRSWDGHTVHADYPRTDANGKMRTLFTPGKYRLGIDIERSPVANTYTLVESKGQEVDLEAGKTTELTFHLRKKAPAAK